MKRLILLNQNVRWNFLFSAKLAGHLISKKVKNVTREYASHDITNKDEIEIMETI